MVKVKEEQCMYVWMNVCMYVCMHACGDISSTRGASKKARGGIYWPMEMKRHVLDVK